MKVFIDNANKALWWCLNVLRWNGILVPEELTGAKKLLMNLYSFSLLMFVVGIYIIVQTGDLVQVWGDIHLMTGASYLLFTNLTYSVKIYNVMSKRVAIQTLIDEGNHALRSEERTAGIDIVERTNQVTTRFLYIYACCTAITVLARVAGAEKGSLPFRAWYPYDTTVSPAYELTYIHQGFGAVVLALVHVSLDVLVTSSTAVCRCRLQLLALSLRTICRDIKLTDMEYASALPFGDYARDAMLCYNFRDLYHRLVHPFKHLISPEQEMKVFERLRLCVRDHQEILESADVIRSSFSATILVQFTVSMIIICVSAYQLAVEKHTSNIRLIAITTYLLDMIIQVYIYCYEGHYLKEESENISDSAYECSWYACSIPVKRTLLIIMARSRRASILTAGGFTRLSLDCFVSLIKASYSLFTVLMQMEE